MLNNLGMISIQVKVLCFLRLRYTAEDFILEHCTTQVCWQELQLFCDASFLILGKLILLLCIFSSSVLNISRSDIFRDFLDNGFLIFLVQLLIFLPCLPLLSLLPPTPPPPTPFTTWRQKHYLSLNRIRVGEEQSTIHYAGLLLQPLCSGIFLQFCLKRQQFCFLCLDSNGIQVALQDLLHFDRMI